MRQPFAADYSSSRTRNWRPAAVYALLRNSGAIAGAILAAVYVSFMVTPPLIGWLAEFFSLQAALMMLGVSGLGMLYLVRSVETS